MKKFNVTADMEFPDLLEYIEKDQLETDKLDKLIIATTARVDKKCCIQYCGAANNKINQISNTILDKKITSSKTYLFGLIKTTRTKTLRQLMDSMSLSFESVAKMQEYYFDV